MQSLEWFNLTPHLSPQEETLDRLEDWLGNIDMAINFHKIGGYPALKHCLTSEHPTLRFEEDTLLTYVSLCSVVPNSHLFYSILNIPTDSAVRCFFLPVCLFGTPPPPPGW